MSFHELKKQVDEAERKAKERKDQEAAASRQEKVSSLIRIRRPEGYKFQLPSATAVVQSLKPIASLISNTLPSLSATLPSLSSDEYSGVCVSPSIFQTGVQPESRSALQPDAGPDFDTVRRANSATLNTTASGGGSESQETKPCAAKREADFSEAKTPDAEEISEGKTHEHCPVFSETPDTPLTPTQTSGISKEPQSTPKSERPFFDCNSTSRNSEDRQFSNSDRSKDSQELPSPLQVPYELTFENMVEEASQIRDSAHHSSDGPSQLEEQLEENTVEEVSQVRDSANHSSDGSPQLDEAVSQNPRDTPIRVQFDMNAKSTEICETLASCSNQDFPILASEIRSWSEHIRKGAMCSVAWSFDRQDEVNVSLGKVSSVYRRKGTWKLNISYVGIVGHKVGEEFIGTLPPHENVRTHRIIWHAPAPDCKSTNFNNQSEGQEESVMMGQSAEQQKLKSKEGWTSKDLDYDPIPTSRVIKPEMMPAVVSSYREIMSEYTNSTYPQRHKIWQGVLSAMKFSLATIREVSNRRRRRRPFETDTKMDDGTPRQPQSAENAADKRAIKKATRLFMEGCTSKAAKVMDQKFVQKTLTDDQTLEKLKDLHPQHEYKFDLPSGAPLLTGLDISELRAAGTRLAKGVSPGPTGTTDSMVRILIDDPICGTNLCHMLMDLINGVLSQELMQRLTRARLVAIEKSGGGVRPVAIGEVFMKLAGNVLVQRYETVLQPLFTPIQQGVLWKAGCERIIHTLNERYRTGACILSIDLKNAFNSPSRENIAKHIFGLSTLRPFQRFFHAEYAEPSELLFYGTTTNGLAGIVKSTNGVRQGSTLSTIYFCAFLQPILETLAGEFPEVNVHAYVDDVNLVLNDAVHFFSFRPLFF